MAKKFKKVGDSEHFHTTEAEFDNPEIGDVRVDRSRRANPDGTASDQVSFRVYVYDERDEVDQYLHKTNTPAANAPPGAKVDKDGYYIVNNERVSAVDTPEVWLLHSEHDTFEEAKAEADKIA